MLAFLKIKMFPVLFPALDFDTDDHISTLSDGVLVIQSKKSFLNHC
jgi:hypothetical protein